MGGAYGVVYSAVNTKTNDTSYAVKYICKYNTQGTRLSRRQMNRRLREISLHCKASTHPNIIPIFKVIDDYDGIYVVMEYCPESDLFWNICHRGRYVGNDQLCKTVFLQILDAVEHCHNIGIYHRDLKPENILVAHHGWTVKLTDFGLATAGETSSDFGCGSERYMSPECLSPNPESEDPRYYCAPNDVWALGIILINLTCGRYPWVQATHRDPTYHAFTASKITLDEFLPVTEEVNDILNHIFQPKPELRITLSELRLRIFACDRFTTLTTAKVSPHTPPLTPPNIGSSKEPVGCNGRSE